MADLKKRLFRWWMQGKDLSLNYFGGVEDTSVLVEFHAIGKQVLIQKESGETPDQALRRYFADFKNWKAQEEETELGEMRIGLVIRNLFAELDWEFQLLVSAFT